MILASLRTLLSLHASETGITSGLIAGLLGSEAD